jgi:DNA-directed RNA polymerase specialized sigma24 family protein
MSGWALFICSLSPCADRVFRARWLVSGEHGEGRLWVEGWEIELAKRIAGSFRVGDEELQAELLTRLADLKATHHEDIQNWQAFLARSLYNAAKNFLRHEDMLRRKFQSLDWQGDVCENRRPSLEERLAAPEEPAELRLDLPKVWNALPPQMRKLWQLLSEEEGNTSSVAKRLGRPRKTVEYWIQKLETFLRNRGLP